MSRIVLTLSLLCLVVGCSPEPKAGVVLIELSQYQADVTAYMDGREIELIGLRSAIEMEVGPHQLRVEGEGYETVVRQLTVKPGKNDLVYIRMAPTVAEQQGERVTSVPLINPDAKRQPGEAGLQTEGQPTSPVSEMNTTIAVAEAEEPEIENTNPTDSSSPTEREAEWTEDEREVAEWVVNMGGQLTERGHWGVVLPGHARFDDSDFGRFTNLPSLQSIYVNDRGVDWWVSGRDISDWAILQLAGLPSLRIFVAKGPEITDVSMEHLSRFPLHTLVVFNASVSDEGLSHFSRHQLRSLSLHNCADVGDTGLEMLELSTIGLLRVSGTRISDRTLENLSEEQQGLRTLEIGRTQVTGEGLDEVGKHSKLGTLYLDQLPIHDVQLAPILELEYLWRLSLSNTQITAHGLRMVTERLHNLTSLSAMGLSLDGAVVVDWSQLQKLSSLNYSGNNVVTDRQLQQFANLPSLTDLRINTKQEFCKVTRQGLLDFQTALPNCKINTVTVDELIRELAAQGR